MLNKTSAIETKLNQFSKFVLIVVFNSRAIIKNSNFEIKTIIQVHQKELNIVGFNGSSKVAISPSQKFAADFTRDNTCNIIHGNILITFSQAVQELNDSK